MIVMPVCIAWKCFRQQLAGHESYRFVAGFHAYALGHGHHRLEGESVLVFVEPMLFACSFEGDFVPEFMGVIELVGQAPAGLGVSVYVAGLQEFLEFPDLLFGSADLFRSFLLVPCSLFTTSFLCLLLAHLFIPGSFAGLGWRWAVPVGATCYLCQGEPEGFLVELG